MSTSFLFLTQKILFLCSGMFVMFDLPFPIFVCDVDNLFFACLLSAHVSATYWA